MQKVVKTDELGAINALVAHMMSGGCCDNIDDENCFCGRVNMIAGKMELVIEENFGGDISAFHKHLLVVTYNATIEEDDPVEAIDNWLDAELNESSKLYN